jgi:hypothetical protein
MGATNQAGARWLAQERIGAATEEPVEPGRVTNPKGGDPATQPPRYPLSECMSDRAVVEWFLVLQEFGLVH